MNRNPTPRHSKQILLRSNPVAPQEAHSSQSAMFVALWFIPWQRSSPMILLQRPFATVALYPAAPHSVQHVFGNSLFRARRYLLTKRGHILPEQPMATSTPYHLRCIVQHEYAYDCKAGKFNVFNSDGESRGIFHEGITSVFEVILKDSYGAPFKRQFT